MNAVGPEKRQRSSRSRRATRYAGLLAAVTLIGVAAGGTGRVVPAHGAGPPAMTAIAAGWGHTCALTSGGSVKCWGLNHVGQLGDGTTTDRDTPVDVVGLTSGVTAIAAGGNHSCALTSVGGVKCWGGNHFGGAGDGTIVDRWMPVDTVGLSTGVTAITAGSFHSCALTSQGAVKCWGLNDYGQVGDGSEADRLTAVQVTGLVSGIVKLQAGARHTCAINSSGGLKCWGDNEYGQLGNSTGVASSTPVATTGLASGVTAVSPGGRHTCATTSAGAPPKCWGANSAGQVGDGSQVDRLAPVDVAGLTNGAEALGAGRFHTCALDGGQLACWGSSQAVADPNDPVFLTPRPIDGFAASATAIAAGDFHTCVLLVTGQVQCVGSNAEGQLGDGSGSLGSAVPVTVAFGAMPSVAADYDGNGTTDIAVFRPSAGTWFVRDGITATWGVEGDIPAPGDYDGNGTTDIAVFRPSTGTWFVRDGITATWGADGDTPAPGDYDGNGTTDIAVFRPSTGTWFVRDGTSAAWGADGDVPVPGDYQGSGTTDIAAFRPSTGTWFVRDGITTGWGVEGDIPA